jgi:steroid delta-isomerase-like uncharacterized protein
MAATHAIIHAYYAAFNAGDMQTFLGLLAEDVIHDVSQGGREQGCQAFARFMDHMNRCYRERVEDLVVMVEPDDALKPDGAERRAAAEFTVHGRYLATDPGVPPGTAPAIGQSYILPAGAFFTLRGDRIARVANHYNLGDWVRQVGAPPR